MEIDDTKNSKYLLKKKKFLSEILKKEIVYNNQKVEWLKLVIGKNNGRILFYTMYWEDN